MEAQAGGGPHHGDEPVGMGHGFAAAMVGWRSDVSRGLRSASRGEAETGCRYEQVEMILELGAG